MKILMIGNGFDLAHKLPTSYDNFLDFCDIIYRMCSSGENNILNLINKSFSDYPELKDRLIKISQDSPKEHNIIKDFYELTNNNIWLQYLKKQRKNKKRNLGKNWIDIEAEISKKVTYLEQQNRFLTTDLEIVDLVKIKNSADYNLHIHDDAYINFEFIHLLETHLNVMIRALEIYLVEFVETLKISEIPLINNIKPQLVLSFNYTNTYSKVYGNNNKILDCHHIHGLAQCKNTVDTNNMVLGISESLSDNEKNTNLQFISFKKYFQRIYKKTGNKYLQWLEIDKPQKYNVYDPIHFNPKADPIFELYIYGHSMDITDGDVIKRFLLRVDTVTTIYYIEKNDLKSKIANLVKIIGQEELIYRTGVIQTIKFEPILE